MQHFELLIIPESLLLTLWNHLLSQNAPFTSSLLEKILNFLKCQDTPLCGGWLVLFDHSMQDYTVMKCHGKMLTVTTYSRKSPCRMHTAGGSVKEVAFPPTVSGPFRALAAIVCKTARSQLLACYLKTMV